MRVPTFARSRHAAGFGSVSIARSMIRSAPGPGPPPRRPRRKRPDASAGGPGWPARRGRGPSRARTARRCQRRRWRLGQWPDPARRGGGVHRQPRTPLGATSSPSNGRSWSSARRLSRSSLLLQLGHLQLDHGGGVARGRWRSRPSPSWSLRSRWRSSQVFERVEGGRPHVGREFLVVRPVIGPPQLVPSRARDHFLTNWSCRPCVAIWTSQLCR